MKTDWKAILVRVVILPLYFYLSVAGVISAYDGELSLNLMDWSSGTRAALASMYLLMCGIVLFGYLDGGFDK